MTKLRNRVVDEFRTATGQTREQITEAQEHERVFSAAEALDCGYIDHIT